MSTVFVRSNSPKPELVNAAQVSVGQLFIDKDGDVHHRVNGGSILFGRDPIPTVFVESEFAVHRWAREVVPIKGVVDYRIATDHNHRYQPR